MIKMVRKVAAPLWPVSSKMRAETTSPSSSGPSHFARRINLNSPLILTTATRERIAWAGTEVVQERWLVERLKYGLYCRTFLGILREHLPEESTEGTLVGKRRRS
jgi:hypothetical protein